MKRMEMIHMVARTEETEMNFWARKKAGKLIESGNPRALQEFLEDWRTFRYENGATKVHKSPDFILAVVFHHGELTKQAIKPTFVVGDLTVDCQNYTIFWKQEKAPLTISEFKIVELLASKPNEYFTYRQIYDSIHYSGFHAGNGAQGYRTNVRSMIKRIRNKLMKMDAGFNSIIVYSGVGYKWEHDNVVPLKLSASI